MDSKKISGVFIFLLIFMMFSINLSSAQTCSDQGFMGRFQQNTNITLTQTCPTCTFINISITDPSSNIILNNTPMILANGLFSFTQSNSTITSELGIYFVQGFSNLNTPFKSCYIITNITRQIDTSEAIVYIILTAAVFVMFLFCIWGAIGLPARNRRNELNRVISVEIMKYPKLGCMFLSYAFFTWFINILLILSNTLVTLTAYQGFFTMMFNFLMAGLYAVFVGMIVIFFWLGAKDLKLVELLTRGINPR